jgi:hypothetical protein
MKKEILLLALVLGCGVLPPSIIESGNVVADCSKSGVQSVARDMLTSVEFDMLQSDWKTLLGQQAIKLGEEALSCIIDHIVNHSRIDVRASADVNARTKVARGEEWLAAKNVRFKKPN